MEETSGLSEAVQPPTQEAKEGRGQITDRQRTNHLSLALWMKATAFRVLAHTEAIEAASRYWHRERNRYALAAIKLAPHLYERFETDNAEGMATVRIKKHSLRKTLESKQREMHVRKSLIEDVPLSVVANIRKESQHEATQTPRL